MDAFIECGKQGTFGFGESDEMTVGDLFRPFDPLRKLRSAKIIGQKLEGNVLGMVRQSYHNLRIR